MQFSETEIAVEEDNPRSAPLLPPHLLTAAAKRYHHVTNSVLQKGGRKTPKASSRRTHCPKPPPFPPPAHLLAPTRARTPANMRLPVHRNAVNKDGLPSDLPRSADLVPDAWGHTQHGLNADAQTQGMQHPARRPRDPIGQRCCDTRIPRWGTRLGLRLHKNQKSLQKPKTLHSPELHWITLGTRAEQMLVPPSAPAMITMTSPAHTPTQQHQGRTEKMSVARPHTRQRQNDTKIACARPIVTGKSYLRQVNQTNAGSALPSARTATLTCEQPDESEAKAVDTRHTLELLAPDKDERKTEKQQLQEGIDSSFHAELEQPVGMIDPEKGKKRQLQEVIDSSLNAELEQPVEVSDRDTGEHNNKRRQLEKVMDSSFDAELEQQECPYGVLDVFVRWIDARRKLAEGDRDCCAGAAQGSGT